MFEPQAIATPSRRLICSLSNSKRSFFTNSTLDTVCASNFNHVSAPAHATQYTN